MASDLMDRVEHGYADSNGVKIHFASIGEGPLVVMIHGFPDFWYSWRHQMEELSSDFQVVAIDQRGYNRSDQPDGDENYDMRYLVGDVAAVIRHLGRDKATIVGHDWGGAVAWQFAFHVPQMTERLIILNLPHPNGMGRELANNQEQQQNSGYARKFQEGSSSDPDIFFGMPMTPQTLSGWVQDQEARKHYVAAFERSDFGAMLAYYKRNYPREGGGGIGQAEGQLALTRFRWSVRCRRVTSPMELPVGRERPGLGTAWRWATAATSRRWVGSRTFPRVSASLRRSSRRSGGCSRYGSPDPGSSGWRRTTCASFPGTSCILSTRPCAMESNLPLRTSTPHQRR